MRKLLSTQATYIKQVSSRLWRSRSQVVGEEVSKKNVQAVLHRHPQSHPVHPSCNSQAGEKRSIFPTFTVGKRNSFRCVSYA